MRPAHAATICAMLATAVAMYTVCSWFSSPTCTIANEGVILRRSGLPTASPTLQQARETPRALCNVGHEYAKGTWVRNESITEYPYLGGDDYEWEPRCTDLQKEYLATGAVPDFLKYGWQPESCDLARFDKEDLCRRLDGLTVGIIGDSTQQQFAHSFIGLMLGKYLDKGFFVTPDDGKLLVKLCPNSQYSVNLMFRRLNKYQGTEEDQKVLAEMAQLSDYLIVNFGVHYQPWNEMEKATQDLTRVLEEHWQPPQKKQQRLMWRSTIAAHDNCGASTGPIEGIEHALHKNPNYNTDEIMLQDKQIVQPLLKFSPKLDVTFLRIEKSTLMRSDGHRVVGHHGSEDCLHYCEPGPTDSWVELFYHCVVMGI